MAACNPGPTFHADASDLTVCPWTSETGYCVFLKHPVSITDVHKAQKCVHSDWTQDAIRTCENATSNKVPFFSLQLTEFGHPMYEGIFPSCTNAANVLKRQVEKLPLRDAENKEVDETSAAAVNALNKTLKAQSKGRTQTVMDWSKEWHKDKLVEERSQDEKNKHTILITKCLGAEKEFRIFYEVR
jgi:hypothetical protein